MNAARRENGNNVLATGVTLVASLVLFSACARPPRLATGQGGWTTETNQRARLSDYKGKVVLLDFYATWCEPCRAETPHLVKLQRQYGDKGLQVIGLNVGGEDDRSEVPAYAKEFGIQYPLAYPDDDVVDLYLSDNQNIPQSYIFGRDGKVLRRFIGFDASRAAEIDGIIQQALGVDTVVNQTGR